MNRVVITGMGWITPMGHDVEGVWRRLLAGESGIERTTLFDASTFPTTFSAEIKNFRLAEHVPDAGPHKDAGRNTQFALAACMQAWRGGGRGGATLGLGRGGGFLGGGEGGLAFWWHTAGGLASWPGGRG